MKSTSKKVIVLLGPTGVGKTGAALLLAKKLDTEIISADSMQIYRHMDIGTAKPSRKEMAFVTHHMIDIVNPWEAFSTGRYISMVAPVIEDLHKKERIPIVVGGTGLYIKAMTRGIFSGPAADWTLRENLISMETEEGGSLYAYLKKLDPEAAEKITPNDTRRIVRALEVYLKGHASISEMQKRLTQPLPYDFIKIGLSRDRKELYRIIETRVDAMLQHGLMNEVKTVADMIKERLMNRELSSHAALPITHDPSPAIHSRLPISHDPSPMTHSPLPSMQAIGYKEVSMCLQGEISPDETVSLIKRATKRYAKRQFTWFKKEEGIHWVDITGISESDEAFVRVWDVLKDLL